MPSTFRPPCRLTSAFLWWSLGLPGSTALSPGQCRHGLKATLPGLLTYLPHRGRRSHAALHLRRAPAGDYTPALRLPGDLEDYASLHRSDRDLPALIALSHCHRAVAWHSNASYRKKSTTGHRLLFRRTVPQDILSEACLLPTLLARSSMPGRHDILVVPHLPPLTKGRRV